MEEVVCSVVIFLREGCGRVSDFFLRRGDWFEEHGVR